MSKVLFLVSPTLNSFVDKRKGTMGNRIDCATKHAGNAIVTHTIAGASLAGAAAIGRAVASKTPELAQSFATMNPIKKAFKYFAAAPKPVKIAAAAVATVMALLYTYKAGKIEQKYLDRAQFVDHTFNLDGEGIQATKIATDKK